MPPDRTRPDDPHRARLNPLHSTDLHPPPSSARLPYDPYQQTGQPQRVSPATSTASVARPAHSLGRGRACRRCRQRKTKCDGRQQPMCGPCETLALRTGQELSSVVCDFDTEEERKKPVGGGKVAALEAKISALEARIQELTEGKEEPMGPSPAYHDASSPASSAASLSSTALSAQPLFPSQPHPTQASPYQAAGLPPPLEQAYSPSTAYPPPLTPRSASFPSLPAQAFAPPPAFPPPSTFPQGPAFPAPRFADPFYPPYNVLPPAAGLVPPPIPAIPATPVLPLATTPNFPSPPPSATGMRGLPSWPTLRRLINTFFDYPHEAVDLINRRRFMAGFDRSPDDPEFPSECLLHAMVATASDLIGEEAAFEGEERYWAEVTSPTLWHADQADRLIPLCLRRDPKLIQVAQAAVLFSATNLAHGRFLRSYLETSAVVRICVGLGLNHAGSDQRDLPLTALASGRLSLGAPEDDEDVYERAITFWFAYTVEIITGVASGYACCLDERDVTTLLPAAAPYKNDPTARESLYLHSPNFFTSNPPDLIRLVQINLKSMVLMNRVVSFVHRTSALLDAASDNSSMTGQLDHAKIRASPAFQKLEAALEAFQRRTPNQLVALLEPQAFLTPALTSTSVILLHEFLTTGEEGCPSMAKCSEAASVLLQNMHVMNSASFHQRHIPPFLNLCYLVCGRTLVREIALKQARGNAVEEDIARLRGNVESVIERLKASRTPLGPICATSLSALLSKPDIALPPASSGLSSPSSGGLPPMMQLLELTRQRGVTYEALCA